MSKKLSFPTPVSGVEIVGEDIEPPTPILDAVSLEVESVELPTAEPAALVSEGA